MPNIGCKFTLRPRYTLRSRSCRLPVPKLTHPHRLTHTRTPHTGNSTYSISSGLPHPPAPVIPRSPTRNRGGATATGAFSDLSAAAPTDANASRMKILILAARLAFGGNLTSRRERAQCRGGGVLTSLGGLGGYNPSHQRRWKRRISDCGFGCFSVIFKSRPGLPDASQPRTKIMKTLWGQMTI